MDGTGSGSINFDRAAEYYDATRSVDERSLRRIVELIASELRGRGRCLEIGVGTGVLALPIAEAGVPLAGVDLSASMLARLVAKADGRPPFPLVRGDATRLPFGDDSFGGAYARWVLHLIAGWELAVAELTRVVRPGGVIVVEPGGYAGRSREIYHRFRDEAGDVAGPVGLDTREGLGPLDVAMARHGATPRELPELRWVPGDTTVENFFREVEQRIYSWTWRIPDDVLRRSIAAVRGWAEDRFGALDAPLESEHPMIWCAYDVV